MVAVVAWLVPKTAVERLRSKLDLQEHIAIR
jgi:hypothetical protein